MTFNWAVLVAYAVKTGTVSTPLFILYLGLIFWTVGYDTIYACQDIEDDAMVGIKSTARKFGGRVKLGVGVCYLIFFCLITGVWVSGVDTLQQFYLDRKAPNIIHHSMYSSPYTYIPAIWPGLQLIKQVVGIQIDDPVKNLFIFKTNVWQAILWLIAAAGFGLIAIAST